MLQCILFTIRKGKHLVYIQNISKKYLSKKAIQDVEIKKLKYQAVIYVYIYQ